MHTEEVFQQGSDTQILLVDDNPDLISVLSLLFQTQGWNCLTANGVEEAIEILNSANPDIVVSDLMMPEKMGYILYDHIKKDARYSDLPFIFLTAATGNHLKRIALEQGCEAYVTKPFSPADLTSMIKGQVAKSKKRKGIREKVIEEDRKRVIQTLSHEFRTPLVSINTGSELILQSGKALKEEQVYKLIESIWRGGRRLERLVSDFLVIQQISQGIAQSSAEKYKTKTNLKDILDRAIRDFLDRQREPYPNVVIESADLNFDVLVYEVQIVDAIGRLIDNALKYSTSDRTISISAGQNKPGFCYIAVRDFGLGINDLRQLIASMDTIFNQQDREVLEQQGCGFGLFIVNHFVKYNSGKLNIIQPSEGPGLEAVIELPILDTI